MRCFAVATLLAATLVAPLARAQEAPLAESYDRCTALLQQVRTAESLECWRALRARTDHPSVRYGLANALRASGRNREAIREFRRFVAADAAPSEFTRRAQAAIGDLEASLGALELTTVPADARVLIDGEEEPTRGEAIALDPGVHVLVVQAPEYAPLTRRVHVLVGSHERLRVALLPLGAVGPVAPREPLDAARPLTSRTWFRVTVGVAAALLVAGAAVGLTLALSETEARYDGALYNIPASP